MKQLVLILFLLTALFFVSGSASAQYTKEDEEQESDLKPGHDKPVPEKTFRDKLFTGGGFGLSFGTITRINVSPLLGYEISDRLAAGVGATYIYYYDKYYDASTNIYGGRLFSQFYITDNILLHSEYGLLSFEDYINEGRINIKSFMAGAGYRSQVGNSAYFYILALYDFGDPFGGNPGFYTPTNPNLRMGITFGL